MSMMLLFIYEIDLKSLLIIYDPLSDSSKFLIFKPNAIRFQADVH